MGMFDYVQVNDPRFICSEGHDLSDEEFQSKDFGETMGRVSIDGGRVSAQEGYVGMPAADSNRVEIYCECTRCPAFVQFGTGNIVPCSIDFEIEISGDTVVSVSRTSPTTAEWLNSEPLKRHMMRCEGPMPHETARLLHINYRTLRPIEHSFFLSWSQARSTALRAGKSWPLELAVGEYPRVSDT